MTEEEARAAVREEAAREVDIIKIWVDDRNGQYEKLSPALYTAIIDEAHKNGVRVTAHIFNLEDAKGLLRAGIDAFAHGIRDTDVDDEVIALFRERPNVVVVPNLPNPGVATDLGWLRDQIPPSNSRRLRKPSPQTTRSSKPRSESRRVIWTAFLPRA
jgi:imidazolonepropionase-like amidohydrolase